MGHPMRLELTLAGLLVKLANHYTTRGAMIDSMIATILVRFFCLMAYQPLQVI